MHCDVVGAAAVGVVSIRLRLGPNGGLGPLSDLERLGGGHHAHLHLLLDAVCTLILLVDHLAAMGVDSVIYGFEVLVKSILRTKVLQGEFGGLLVRLETLNEHL